jgi:hypothetical protein
MSRSYTSSPPQAPSWRVAGLLYLYLLLVLLETFPKATTTFHDDKAELCLRTRIVLIHTHRQTELKRHTGS